MRTGSAAVFFNAAISLSPPVVATGGMSSSGIRTSSSDGDMMRALSLMEVVRCEGGVLDGREKLGEVV